MKNFNLVTLFLIFVITTSPTMFIDGKAFAIDLDQQTIFENKQIIEQKDLTQKPKHNFITLHESVSVYTADEKKNSELQNVQHAVVDLHEIISVSDITVDNSVIVMIKGNDDRKTMMERIFDRSKLNSIILDSNMYSVEDGLTLASLADKPQSETSYNGLELQIEQSLPIFLINFFVSEKQLDALYESVDEVADQIIITTTSLFDVNSPIFLLMLPLAGFVLIRIENDKLDFNSLKRVFCFVFVTILISSAVITPLSISSAYWGVAYAEELTDVQLTSEDESTIDSSSPIESELEAVEEAAEAQAEAVEEDAEAQAEAAESVDDIILTNFQSLGGSTTTESVEPVNATSVEPVNATSVEPVNATSVEPVNATSVEPVNATSVEPVNATSVEPVNATSVEPVNATSVEPVNATSVEPVNATSVEPVNATSVEPVNATSVEPVNATSVEPVNATSVEPVNATSVEPVNATSVEPVNATSVEPVNATSVEPVNATSVEPVNATSVEPVNATSTEIIDANQTSIESEPVEEIIVPEATVSLQLTEPEPELVSSENATSTEEPTAGILELDGQNDYIQIENVTVTNDFDGLTITVWVKPDYSSGSSEFTVLSKEKSFSLTINNNIQPEQIAKFAVFDGIKWTAAESTSIIEEEWTFLSATFSGETIAIFVNGVREDTEEVAGVPTLSVSGKLEITTVDNITSEEDIVVGATITTKDQNSTPSNQFAGEIDNVSLYDYVLEDEQILAMYEQSKDAYVALEVPELSIEEIIAQIEAELAENNTTTEPVDTTVTELLIAPTLTTTKETYQITEDVVLELEFYDEYDVLMQELEELEIAMALLEAETELTLNQVESDLIVLTATETTTTEDILYFIGKLFTIQKADAAQIAGDDQLKIEIAKVKEEIQKLKDQINAIKNGGTLSEAELKEAKAQLRTVIDQIKVAAMNAKNSQNTSGDDLEISADKIEKAADVEVEIATQKGTWVGTDETIVTVIYGPDGDEINLDYEQIKLRDGKFLIKLLPDRDSKPGLYKIVTTLTKNGQTFVVESEFAWGVLAINIDKSIYLPNENAFIGMAVLDDEGETVCDADVTLTITGPSGAKTTLSTANGGITISEECEVLGVTNLPDYYAEYSVSGIGSYTMDLTAITANGAKSVQDSFTVQSTVEFDVTRDGPTRIFPLVPYTMDFTIKANTDYNGKITEYVPASFEITPQQGLTVTTSSDAKILSWNVNMKSGETVNLYYEFDAPDISPEFYLLGPLEIGSFIEQRQWQIASDAIGFVGDSTMTRFASANPTRVFSVTSTTDTILVAHISTRGGETTTVSSSPALTWTSAGSAGSTSDAPRVEAFWAVPTATGSHTITFTTAATDGMTIVFELSGVDESSPIGNTISNTGSGIAPTATLNIGTANSWAITILAEASNGVITVTGGQTIIDQLQQGGGSKSSTGSSREGPLTTGNDVQSYTLGKAGNWAVFSMEVKEKFVDSTAPRITSIVRSVPTSATTNDSTPTFRVTFDEAVQNVDITDFVLDGSSTATATVDSINVVSSTITDVTYSVTADGSVILGFAGAQNIQDLATNALTNLTPTGANESYTNVDVTLPTITSGATTSSTTIDLTASETVTSTAAASDFVVNGIGANTISTVVASGTTITITLATGSISGGDTVTVDYTQTSGSVIDSETNIMANFAGQAVTNNESNNSVRSVSESVAVSDGTIATTFTNNPESIVISALTESVTISDGTVSTTFTDNPVPNVISPLTESVAVSDGTVSATFTNNPEGNVISPLTESVAVSDGTIATTFTNNPEGNVISPLTESVAVSDGTIAIGTGASRILTESVTISDGTIATTFTNNPEGNVISALTESVAVSDGTVSATFTNNPEGNVISPLTESVAVSDGTIAATFTNIPESIVISALTESVAVSDGTVSATFTNNPENIVISALTESVAVSDGTIATGVGASRPLTESVAVSDGTIATTFTNNPENIVISPLTESVAVSDGTVSATFTNNPENIVISALTESVAVSDGTIATGVGASRPLTESVAVSDGTIATTFTNIPENIVISALTESVAVSDGTVSATFTNIPESIVISALTESVTISDGTVSTTFTNIPENIVISPLTESVAVSDGTVSATFTNIPENIVISALTESVAVSDGTIVRGTGVARPLTESVAVSDGTVSTTFTNIPENIIISALTESVAVSDGTVSTTFTNIPESNVISPLTESVAVSDGTIATGIGAIRPLTESVAVSDGTVSATFTNIPENIVISALTESVAVSDGTVSATFTNIPEGNVISALTESVAVSDGTVSTTFTNIPENIVISALTESVAVSDGTVSATFTNIPEGNVISALTESVAVSDGTIARGTGVARILTESVAVSDGTVSTTFTNIPENIVISALTESVTISDGTVSTTFTDNPVPNVISPLTESVTISDGTVSTTFTNIPESIVISALTESVAVSDGTVSATFTNNPENNVISALTESVAVSDGTVSTTFTNNPENNVISALTESVTISDGTVSTVFTNNPENVVISALTESVAVSDGTIVRGTGVARPLTESVSVSAEMGKASNLSESQELISADVEDVEIDPDRPEIVIAAGSPSNVTISSTVTEPKINYEEIVVSGDGIKTVTIDTDMVINSDFTGDAVTDVRVSFETNTIITGPATWDGVFNLPTIKEPTSITILDTTSSTESGSTSTTTTTTRVVESVIEIGLDDIILTFNQAVRLEFTGKTGLDAFFERGGTATLITTECDADSQSAVDSQLGDGEDCKFDNKTDLIIWTKHFTRFGTASSSSSSTSTASSFAQSAGSSSGTGAGPGSSGASGFGVILFTPLKIHEITYDVCSENMATILVANDDATVPTVTLQTTKSGTVEAILAAEQPFAEKNEFTTVDKYLFLAPLDPRETYMMVQLRAVDGVRVNSVNSAIYITECQGVIQFDEQPEEFEGINFSAPRIFDVKVQIDNGTAQSAISPETPYLDEQELTVSAIVNSQVPLQRAELRYIISGQPADDYIAFLMDITPIEGVDTAVKVSASIPPMFMAAPGIEYWIHVMDVNLDDRSSQHYTMGVKPGYDVDASIELDIPTSKPEGSILRPSAYVMNDSPEAAFGIVSLLVNGKVVSSTSSFFKPGEIVVPLEWSIPKEGRHLIYTVQAKLDFYDVSVTTEKAYVSSFMKTQLISLSEMQSIQPLTGKSGNTVAEPALLYASDSQHDNLRFRVIGNDGFCFIGATEECAVKDSTLNKRGGIESVEHNGIIYRVKYSGADSPLERFSVTSVDQVSTNWNITLESTDDFIPQAFAMQDVHLKIKYRTISEMTTVSSE